MEERKRSRDEVEAPRRGFKPSSPGTNFGGRGVYRVASEHSLLLEPQMTPSNGTLHVRDGGSRDEYLAQPAADALQRELKRNEIIVELYAAFDSLCKSHGITASHLFTAFVFESVIEVSLLRNSSATGALPTTRVELLSIDVGVAVKDKATGSPLGTITSIAYRGGNVATIAPHGHLDAQTDVTMPLAELAPMEPVHLNIDTVIPIGEVIADSHSPRSVREMAFTQLFEKWGTTLSAKQKTVKAWSIADGVTKLAAEARQKLARFRPDPAISLDVIVESTPSEEHVAVRCGVMSHSILKSHWHKLRILYLEGGHDQALFPIRAFNLLTRYHSLAGATDHVEREAAWHCAIPPRVMRVLQKHFEACGECFASPLNCFMRRFCSAFCDTDCFFGSMGSFFNFFPESGSFEVGPPYDNQLITEMFHHLIRLLDASTGPMSFFVILPYSSRESGDRVLSAIRATRYIRHEEMIPKESKFAYVDGFQQCDSHTAFVISCASRIMVLQNEDGATKWNAALGVAACLDAWAGKALSASIPE